MPATLRTTLGTVTVVGTILALLVSSALVALVTLLHQTAEFAVAGVESVHLAQEAEMQLLVLARTGDPLVRHDLHLALEQNLREMDRYVTTDAEARALREAEAAVREHASDNAAQTEARAFRALNQLVALNLEQARDAHTRANEMDETGKIIGATGGVLVLLLAFGMLEWMRRSALRPILELSEVAQRFARGDTNARAAERGAGELRALAQRWNEMASAIAAHRAAQTAFLGGVAHDLRGPLNTLGISVEMLAENDPDIGRRATRQIARLDRMIGDFLDAARIEAGQLEIRMGRCDARDIVREVVNLFEGSSPSHAIQLSMPEQPVPVLVDSARIEQVLTNLVSNAIKYSPAGGDVGVVLEKVGDDTILSVTDPGIGIGEEDQRRLFEPFRRVGLSKEAIPGVGLGLFVVRRIIEAHGGRIEVTSKPGRGSTFRVVLTNARAKERGTARAPVPAQA
jgi:two-component system sensor histidine kinase MtrB